MNMYIIYISDCEWYGINYDHHVNVLMTDVIIRNFDLHMHNILYIYYIIYISKKFPNLNRNIQFFVGKTAVSNPQVLTNAQFLFGSSDGGESSLNKGLLAGDFFCWKNGDAAGEKAARNPPKSLGFFVAQRLSAES